MVQLLFVRNHVQSLSVGKYYKYGHTKYFLRTWYLFISMDIEEMLSKGTFNT